MERKNIIILILTLISSGVFNLHAQTIKDVEGNVYKTVIIGKQVWMAENLKTSKYNDGSVIPKVTNNMAWFKLESPAYCWYNNDEVTYKKEYGALYNWHTINTKKLCPKGWHVPSDVEWTALNTYLGDENAGNKLREKGTNHWQSINPDATNETGFTALPSGYREKIGNFSYITTCGMWWSTTAQYGYTNEAWYSNLCGSGTKLNRSYEDRRFGYSVRCLQDKK